MKKSRFSLRSFTMVMKPRADTRGFYPSLVLTCKLWLARTRVKHLQKFFIFSGMRLQRYRILYARVRHYFCADGIFTGDIPVDSRGVCSIS